MPNRSWRRHHEPVAVIDIGSNSIRLVVYDGLSRTPLPLFNEKAVCALGQGLGATGRLNPQGVELALRSLARFIRLARAMDVERLGILATAAIRDADDGPDFAAEVERRFNVEVQVLTGGQEAKLAAQGVLCGIPEAEGVVADLGGGSCELVAVGGGRTSDHITMPLGVLRLGEEAGNDRGRAGRIVDGHLAGIRWLEAGNGKALYAVGGAWRAIARICIAQERHPIRILDNYQLDSGEAVRLLNLISRQSRKSLEKIGGVSKKRFATLPMAAVVLEKVVKAVRPSRLVFSVYGMREGRFFADLPARIKRQDPLIAACRQLAGSAGRFPEHGDEIRDWMTPLFPRESPSGARLRLAACLLSDVFWNEHPDYRGHQAFLRVLRLPFVGLGHCERAALAMAVLTRHHGSEDDEEIRRAMAMLTEAELGWSRAIGYALRLAHRYSGGAPGLLASTRLVRGGDLLALEVPAGEPAMHPDLVEKTLERLAKAIGCETGIVRPAPPRAFTSA